HWDGVSWSVVSSQNVGSDQNQLNGVAAVTGTNLWAVGDDYTGASVFAFQTLVEHIASPCSPTSTPTSTNTPQARIVGHVTWQGRAAQPNALQQLPITLTLKSGTTEVNYPVQNTDASGFFTQVITLPNGAYNWRVKGPKYLA